MRTLPLFTIAVTATVVSGLVLSVSAAQEFSDVEANTALDASLEVLQKKNAISGYEDGTFRPHALVNRAEFLKVMMTAATSDDTREPRTLHCFRDFVGSTQWYWRHVCRAKERGIVHGYPDGRFRGETNVNLAEALKMATLTWNIPLPQYFRAPDNWYDPYLDTASSFNVFRSIPREPGRILSRAEMAHILAAFTKGMDPIPIDEE